MFHRMVVTVVCVAAGFAHPQSFLHAQLMDGPVGLDCVEVTLQDASASETGTVSYTFSGLCRLDSTDDSTGQEDAALLGLAVIEGVWEPAVREASEQTELSGELTSTINSVYSCDLDPFVGDTECELISMEVHTPWSAIEQSFRRLNRPIMAQRVDADLARELILRGPREDRSGPSAFSGPTLLIGSSVQETMARQGQGNIEAESLIADASSQGRLAVQSVPLGYEGWSGNAQLNWLPEGEGSLLTLPLETSEPGRYEVRVYLSSAPDFGQAEIYVHYQRNAGGAGLAPSFNDTRTVKFDSYSPEVLPPQPVELLVPHTEGPMQLVVRAAGKNPDAADQALGIDRIELAPVD